MVFHWSLSDSKSPQVSRTRLRILAILSNAIIWIVPTRPPTSKSPRPFNNPLVIVHYYYYYYWFRNSGIQLVTFGTNYQVFPKKKSGNDSALDILALQVLIDSIRERSDTCVCLCLAVRWVEVSTIFFFKNNTGFSMTCKICW